MSHDSAFHSRQVDRAGYSLIPQVYLPDEVNALAEGLATAFGEEAGVMSAMRTQAGSIFAARNVLQLYPPARTVWCRPRVAKLLSAELGAEYGLVRALYFDKPPDRTWSLPWHKDLTIAVRDNRRPSHHFTKPTCKAGVPHVEAPLELLQGMLTVRIHLDEMTEENGPLCVLPGSHRQGKKLGSLTEQAQAVLAGRGDVLLIRPLVAHCSVPSRAGTTRHQRILHLEFAAQPDLPDGYAWHDFIRGEPTAVGV